MGRSKRVVHECDNCGRITAGASDFELPKGFHGGEVQVVQDGWGTHVPPWWACSEDCLKSMVEDWLTGKGFEV